MAEYIEREALIKQREEFWQDGCDHMAVRVTNIINIPAADVVEVRHGKWSVVYVDAGHIDMEKMYKCSMCGSRKYNDYKYCPNCGAKMDGKDGTE